MELPRPRAFATDGRSATTHDFLSLYSPAEQDARPGQGDYLQTHNFLQPLEEKAGEKLKAKVVENPDMENSNSSSYTGSGFTLWDESVASKGKTGNNNNIPRVIGTATEWPSVSSSSNHKQSFLHMLTSEELSPHPQKTKANTPRSKHSATEQRRRSKINDRFQMLRGIIPHTDQKRDKASFLLEVIEYIQFLQEKVQKYEGSFQVPGFDPALLFMKPGLPLLKTEPETRPCLVKDVSNHRQFHNPNMSKDIESGRISISSAYSQGLLNNLTHALESAGVDLSQASISVHIDLGKKRSNSPPSIFKGEDVSASNEPYVRSIVTNVGEESGQARKRIKPS